MIYLDYASTTPPFPEVVTEMAETMRRYFANPSSEDHRLGQEAALKFREAREKIASSFGASPARVVFTSGATESVNLALIGFARSFARIHKRAPKILASPIEHTAVLETLRHLQAEGLAHVKFFRVNPFGFPDEEDVKDHLESGHDLFVMMAVNNETGVLLPIREIGDLCREKSIPFFCDASQAAGKIPIDMREGGISAMVVSSHKMYGPKGVGALLTDDSFLYDPLFSGGSQQGGKRPGTIPLPPILGFSRALQICQSVMESEKKRLSDLRDILVSSLSEIPGIQFHTPLGENQSWPGFLHFTIADVYNKMIVAGFQEKLSIATSSACTSGLERPSHVLAALGVPEEKSRGAFRFSFGAMTERTEIEEAAEIFKSSALKYL